MKSEAFQPAPGVKAHKLREPSVQCAKRIRNLDALKASGSGFGGRRVTAEGLSAAAARSAALHDRRRANLVSISQFLGFLPIAFVMLPHASPSTRPAAFSTGATVELVPPVTLTLPGRHWVPARGQSRDESIAQLRELGELLIRGAVAVTDLYLRICTHIRAHDLDPDEVTQALRQAGFSAPRISELRRVAFAPEHIFKEFAATHIGFRVVLAKTRMYEQVRRSDIRVKRRKLRRASARVLRLFREIGQNVWEYRVKNLQLLVIDQLNTTNTVVESDSKLLPARVGFDRMEVRP